MAARFRRLVHAIRSRPLFIAQALSSAAGALAVVFAAVFMPGQAFAVFSMLALVSATLVGAVRAGLLQPALIAQRADPTSLVPFRFAIGPGIAAAGAMVGAAALFGGSGPSSLSALAVASTAPPLYEWMRYRAISADRRSELVVTDGLRFALTLLSPAVLTVTTDAVLFQTFIALTTAPSLAVLLVRRTPITVVKPFRGYRGAARHQFVEFVIGQFTITVPILVLGVVGYTPLLAGVRLAQTLLGPLNLVFTAATTTLLADGATHRAPVADAALIRSGRRIGRRLDLLTAATLGALLLIVWLSRIDLSGVANEPLLGGIILAGVYTLGSRGASVHAVIMRMLGAHLRATACRSALVAIALLGFIGGYVTAGIDGALVAGLCAGGLASALLFGLAGRNLYARFD